MSDNKKEKKERKTNPPKPDKRIRRVEVFGDKSKSFDLDG